MLVVVRILGALSYGKATNRRSAYVSTQLGTVSNFGFTSKRANLCLLKARRWDASTASKKCRRVGAGKIQIMLSGGAVDATQTVVHTPRIEDKFWTSSFLRIVLLLQVLVTIGICLSVVELVRLCLEFPLGNQPVIRSQSLSIPAAGPSRLLL